jgi:hypothetical protein
LRFGLLRICLAASLATRFDVLSHFDIASLSHPFRSRGYIHYEKYENAIAITIVYLQQLFGGG